MAITGIRHLGQRAAEHGEKLAEEAEDHVTGLVKDQVDPVDEGEHGAVLQRQSLGEDRPGQDDEDQEPQTAAGDRRHPEARVALGQERSVRSRASGD